MHHFDQMYLAEIDYRAERIRSRAAGTPLRRRRRTGRVQVVDGDAALAPARTSRRRR